MKDGRGMMVHRLAAVTDSYWPTVHCCAAPLVGHVIAASAAGQVQSHLDKDVGVNAICLRRTTSSPTTLTSFPTSASVDCSHRWSDLRLRSLSLYMSRQAPLGLLTWKKTNKHFTSNNYNDKVLGRIVCTQCIDAVYCYRCPSHVA